MHRVYNCGDCLNKDIDCTPGCSNYELKPTGYKLKENETDKPLYTIIEELIDESNKAANRIDFSKKTDEQEMKIEYIELIKDSIKFFLKTIELEDHINVEIIHNKSISKLSNTEIELHPVDIVGVYFLNNFIVPLIEKR